MLQRLEKDSKDRQKTVLVCEDLEELRRLIRIVLEKSGYVVIEAKDGVDAVEKFRQNEDKIALIIMDVVMPNKNGREVYDEIASIRSNARVLFISGYTFGIIDEKEILEKGLHFIEKPFSPKDLLRRVTDILGN
jgi:DNA-binding response OmpR family regulator